MVRLEDGTRGKQEMKRRERGNAEPLICKCTKDVPCVHPHSEIQRVRVRQKCSLSYRIALNFRRAKFSHFLQSSLEPRKLAKFFFQDSIIRYYGTCEIFSTKHFQLHDPRKLCTSKIWHYTV